MYFLFVNIELKLLVRKFCLISPKYTLIGTLQIVNMQLTTTIIFMSVLFMSNVSIYVSKYVYMYIDTYRYIFAMPNK